MIASIFMKVNGLASKLTDDIYFDVDITKTYILFLTFPEPPPITEK